MKFIDAIIHWLSDWSLYITSIMIGITAKISYEIRSGRNLKLVQWIWILTASVVCGYGASVFCRYNEWTAQSGFIVPAATLTGERILIYVMDNWKKWILKLAK